MKHMSLGRLINKYSQQLHSQNLGITLASINRGIHKPWYKLILDYNPAI